MSKTSAIHALALVFAAGFAELAPAEPPVEFRAFWADAFHEGLKNTAQIDVMVGRARQGHYNAIIAQVLAYHDNTGAGHGAYWNSSIVPKATDIAGGIDPLAYLVQQAHAVGIEVHCWLVPYRVSLTWPPSGNAAIQPHWLMVSRAAMGSVAPVAGAYVLDPGSPSVQNYLISIASELATNYAIDGIHWDSARYPTTDAGYPADAACTTSTLARFHRISGRVDVPLANGDAQWDNFRRRTVTELIRRMGAELPQLDSDPQRPRRHSAALVTTGDAPPTFALSSAYLSFQDWRAWMEAGYLDMGVPTCFFDETLSPLWYRHWVDAAIGWRYSRHMSIGVALSLNSFADAKTQIEYARSAGADGIATYSYSVTNRTGTPPWPDWYGYAGVNVFPEPAVPPGMPWRDPATATEGTLYGQVTEAGTGEPIDDATVWVGALPPVQTDGNGYYAVTRIPASGSGASYDVTATKAGWPSVTHEVVVVVAGTVVIDNLELESPYASSDFNQDDDVDLADFSLLAACFNGPNRAPASRDCSRPDLDNDGDVDLTDFGVLASCFNGPNRPPVCLP